MLNAEGGGCILNIRIVDGEANIRKTLSYCLATEAHTDTLIQHSLYGLESWKAGTGHDYPGKQKVAQEYQHQTYPR